MIFLGILKNSGGIAAEYRWKPLFDDAVSMAGVPYDA